MPGSVAAFKQTADGAGRILMAEDASMAERGRTIVLPVVLDAIVAPALKLQLEAACAQPSDLVLDSSAVQRVTTPCLQVLASGVRTFARMGSGTISFGNSSQEFRETVQTVGLASLFGLGD